MLLKKTLIAVGLALSVQGLAYADTAAQKPSTSTFLPSFLGLPDFTSVVASTENGVVNIRTMRTRGAARGQHYGFNDDPDEFFQFFFGPDFPGSGMTPRRSPRYQDKTPEREVPGGVGSGFIISEDGYIITNDHVVDKASKVLVTLTNGKEYEAEVVGSDKRTDLALLKIEATGLQALKIGDSDKLKKGQWVLAIGSPYDLESTVTSGIVSAINRDTGDYLPFVQTDVAINPGNSGGPLIDLQGKVVGVNSQIYTRSGGSMGISFSIPINEAMNVIEQLKSTGVVQRGRIGVMIGEVQKEVADALGLENTQGALVRQVERNSPAEEAGVLSGDVILSFDGKTIQKWSDLPRLVGQTKPGTEVEMEVWRRGKKVTLDITIEKAKSEERISKKRDSDEKIKADEDRLGLSVSSLSKDKEKELRITGGVFVEKAEGAAAEAGLRKGDVILAVNNKDVESLKHYQELVEKLPKDKTVALLVRRDDLTQWVTVTPTK